MMTIGFIGGMSWESSIEYYRLANELVKERLGGLHSCRCVMYSVDFAEIEVLQHQGRWDQLGSELVEAARKLEKAGAEIVLICTNTMHKVAELVESSVGIPLLHIADATAGAVKAQGIVRAGLLGTRFTMEQDFYRDRLAGYQIDVIVPEKEDIEVIHSVIYNELVVGRINDSSREKCLSIIQKLKVRGAEGIILGCTELPLLIRQKDSPIPIFNTMLIHAQAAIDLALADNKQ